jgi:DNA repair exonuclease SbcCD nuclease subunit
MPPLKIFHCADLHLGLRFSRYPEGIAEQLREARFTSLEKMVERANREGCELFVVAGDLFDTLKVAQRDLLRAAKILSRFDRLAVVLPGNHDFHAGPSDDFWKGFPLPDHGRLLLLSESRAYPLQAHGLDAVLYAAPCGAKYSETHGVGWLRGAARPEARFHIGLAHGSFEGLSPDLQGNYFPMKSADLHACGLDLWLLGHIHVPFPPKPGPSDRIFYSGTHEPDGFDCRHEGRSWLLELREDKSLLAEPLSTGNFRFLEAELELHALSDLEAFARRLPDGERTLLKLTLRGSLAREEHGRFGETVERLKERLLYLKPDFSGVTVTLAPAEIDREFAAGSFPHRLLTELSGGEPEALQTAFALLQECLGEDRR